MGVTAKQKALKAAKAAARAAAAAEQAQQTTEGDTRRAALIATAVRIVRALGEEQYAARLQVLRCVRLLGGERALELLAEALRIDGDGGELLPSGGRYRTPGGIFFRLVRERVTPDEWMWTHGGEASYG